VIQPFKCPKILSQILALAVFFVFAFAPCLQAKDIKTFAVLPFTIHADKDISYVKKGVSRMLYSRLSWPGNVIVIPPRQIEAQVNHLDGMTQDKLIQAISETTRSQYVLSGSITQLAGAFSIDAKVFDIANKRYMAFFEQSKQEDQLIEKVDRIAAAINQQVFERSTVTWEQMQQERQKAINDYKRRNPEHLMKMPPGYRQEEKIGWKVWKYLF